MTMESPRPFDLQGFIESFTEKAKLYGVERFASRRIHPGGGAADEKQHKAMYAALVGDAAGALLKCVGTQHEELLAAMKNVLLGSPVYWEDIRYSNFLEHVLLRVLALTRPAQESSIGESASVAAIADETNRSAKEASA